MKNKEPFFTRDRDFYRRLVSLAIPMLLQNLITFSVGLADNLMIGSLGDSAVSGVYMGGQIQTALQVLSTGIESAVLLICAQYWGRRDTASVRRLACIGLRVSFILGMIFTTVCAVIPEAVIRIFTSEEAVVRSGTEYLAAVCLSFVLFCMTQSLIAAMRSVEDARVGMAVSLCSLVFNVFFNYVLIFGRMGFPALGVRGAAIATVISRAAELLLILIYVRFIDRRLGLRASDITVFDRGLLRDFVKYGLPLMAGQLVWGANMMANGMIIGRFAETVITGASLANTVNSLIYVGMNGVAGAVGIIIGKTVGSGDLSRIKEYARTTQLIMLGLGLTISGIFICLRGPFISLYSISDGAAEYARQFIGILCVTCIGTCYQAGSLMGLIKSGGDVSFVFRNDTVFVFCVVIPSALITALLGCPPAVVFFCLKCDQIFKCIPAFFKIRKYNWMKKLTRE